MNIIVTGGSRGIGRCLVQNLARNGHNVLLNYNKSEEQAQKTQERLEEILKNIFEITNEQVSYTITKDGNQLNLVIKGDDMSHLIGYKGKTIEAFQSLLNSMLQREDEDYAKVFVEINDYKKKKEEKLRKLANKMAANCVKFRRPIQLYISFS